MSREGWKAAFAERAAEHWTQQRLDSLLEGKRLLVSPENAPDLLRALGLLHRDASLPPRQTRKFFQLNHMLKLLGPPLEELRRTRAPLTIVDAGCGLAYLTTALAWCFSNVFHHPVRVLGVDRNEAAVAESSRRSTQLGLTEFLRFRAGNVADLNLKAVLRDEFGSEAVDVVMALHACDTATDDAIALGCRNEARLIAVAPCCQAQLARRWSGLAAAGAAGAFAPVWSTPHLRREAAATLTDTFRTLLLQSAGYETRTVEFVASVHTPKNTLIRAMRRPMDQAAADAAHAAYRALRAASGGEGIELERQIGAGLSSNSENSDSRG